MKAYDKKRVQNTDMRQSHFTIGLEKAKNGNQLGTPIRSPSACLTNLRSSQYPNATIDSSLKEAKQKTGNTNFKLGFNKMHYLTTNKEIFSEDLIRDSRKTNQTYE